MKLNLKCWKNGLNLFIWYHLQNNLNKWQTFKADPDILTGYNIINFDLPYLLDRAAVRLVR